jgi:hypothetical protein
MYFYIPVMHFQRKKKRSRCKNKQLRKTKILMNKKTISISRVLRKKIKKIREKIRTLSSMLDNISS